MRLRKTGISCNRRRLRSVPKPQETRALCRCLNPELQGRRGSSSLEKRPTATCKWEIAYVQQKETLTTAPFRSAPSLSLLIILREQTDGSLPGAGIWPRSAARCSDWQPPCHEAACTGRAKHLAPARWAWNEGRVQGGGCTHRRHAWIKATRTLDLEKEVANGRKMLVLWISRGSYL